MDNRTQIISCVTPLKHSGSTSWCNIRKYELYHSAFIYLLWFQRQKVSVFVAHGCEARSVTLKEEQLRMLENMVLRNVFGTKRGDVTGEWRRLLNTEVCNLYSSPHTIWIVESKRIMWARHVARIGDRRGAYRVLVKTGGKENPWKV